MLSIRSVPRSAFSALGLGFLLSLAACGGGSSGAAEAATGPGDTPTGGGGGGGPTVPPGFNPDLDPILSQLAQRANAGPLPKGP